MKEKIEVSFGNVNETPESLKPKKEVVKENEEKNDLGTIVEVEPIPEQSEVEEDPYAEAVDTLFAQYQIFQEGMNGLPKMIKQPGLMQLALNKLLKDFQEAIDAFKKEEHDILDIYQEGHDFILQALEKYEKFLVEYPKALQGKNKTKAMMKITSLGKLSGQADQDMKSAFRSFQEAVEAMEAGEKNA